MHVENVDVWENMCRHRYLQILLLCISHIITLFITQQSYIYDEVIYLVIEFIYLAINELMYFVANLLICCAVITSAR